VTSGHPGRVVSYFADDPPAPPHLAISRLTEHPTTVEAFLARHEVPIVEGRYCTFLHRGEADEVRLVHRIVGLPGRLPMRRLAGTDLWHGVLELPEGSRLDYQIESRRGDDVACANDALNPRRSYGPLGTSSVCFAHGYETPEWTRPDPEARPGELTDLVVDSRAFGGNRAVTVYLPAGFRRSATYPLLVVHDGGDFLRYSAAQVVLDNLVHRREVAPVVAAFLHPKDRLTEYADSAEHARFVTHELLPGLAAEFPLSRERSGRCLLGSSFGAVASLSTAYRSPRTYGSLVLLSGSFVFVPTGTDHGGGPAFDPVVRFVNRYRRAPRQVADRLYAGCGQFEPLIIRNRAMVPVFESTGMAVRYVEAPDGHSWVNWRDRLRDALSWVLPAAAA